MDRHTYTQRTRDMETQADRLRKAKEGNKRKEKKYKEEDYFTDKQRFYFF